MAQYTTGAAIGFGVALAVGLARLTRLERRVRALEARAAVHALRPPRVPVLDLRGVGPGEADDRDWTAVPDLSDGTDSEDLSDGAGGPRSGRS